MKTTVELDEKKLKRVMKLAGLKTRKAAIDFALTEAVRMAKLHRLVHHPLPDEAFADAIDPNYDLMKMREMEKPKYDDLG